MKQFYRITINSRIQTNKELILILLIMSILIKKLIQPFIHKIKDLKNNLYLFLLNIIFIYLIIMKQHNYLNKINI